MWHKIKADYAVKRDGQDSDMFKFAFVRLDKVQNYRSII